MYVKYHAARAKGHYTRLRSEEGCNDTNHYTHPISGVCNDTGMTVKQDKIALPEPTHTAGSNCTAPCVITGNLVATLCGTAEFRSGDHAILMGEGRDDINRRHAEAAETALVEAWAATSMEEACRMGWITHTGDWMSVPPFNINGTELGSQEWMDYFFLSYGINPSNLPDNFNECGTEFDICHSLDCNKGGLITARHNRLCDGVSDLASKAFNPMHVRDDPKIYTHCVVRGGKDKIKGSPLKDEGDLKGVLLIRDL